MSKQKLLSKAFPALLVFVCIHISSCNNRENKLTAALAQAGTNKDELIKVIDHYKKAPADSLKLGAAYFLIKNMPAHFSYDTTYLSKYRLVTEKIKELRIKDIPLPDIREQVNPLMDSLISRYPLSYIYSIPKSDLTNITSGYLIHTIDQAFESYQTNPFKDQILFDDFLEYILPYRIQNGYSMEEWRPYFKNNYPINSPKKFVSVQQLCDSLLYNFKTVKIGWRLADQFPYLKLNDYLTSLLANCPQKCWFNCMLLRSYGVPVSVDFVPASRVHPPGHEWNVLKLKSGIYPLEPFWQDSLRNLKPFYTRQTQHPTIGPIQFPKIYRKTFGKNSNKLLEHAIKAGENIPGLFRDPFIKDVTDEYLKTFELKSEIIRKVKHINYAYACVLGSGQTWVPVDFGEVKNNSILFRSLGSENVYLPAYYQSNSIVPAAYPILLQKNGSTSILRPNMAKRRDIMISKVAFEPPSEMENRKAFIGATIEGSNNREFKNPKILYKFKQAYEAGTYRVRLNSKKKYRYFRLILPNNNIKLNEIKFLKQLGKDEEDVRGRLISSSFKDSLGFTKIVDRDLLSSTVFKSDGKNSRKNYDNKIWGGYDFKRQISLNEFEFYFVLTSNLRKEGIYELLYWDFGWQSLGTKKSYSTAPLSFAHVPENALLMIRIIDTGNYSRIFTSIAGRQHWY